MKASHTALAVLVMLIWGSNYAVTKVAIEEVPPIAFLCIRFVVIAAVLLPFVRMPRGKMLHVFFYAITMGGIQFGLTFTGLIYVDASTVALISQIGVPFATVVAAFVFKDYPGWRRWLGILVAFTGAAVIAGEPRFEGGFLPLLMIIVGALAWGVSSVQVKAMGEINPFALNAWMAVFCVPMLAAWSLLFESDQVESFMRASWYPWAALLYQSALVAIVGYGFWFWLIRRYPVSLLMPFTLLGPMFGVALGVLWLGDDLTLNMIGGGVMTIIGVAIVVIRRPGLVAEAQR